MSKKRSWLLEKIDQSVCNGVFKWISSPWFSLAPCALESRPTPPVYRTFPSPSRTLLSGHLNTGTFSISVLSHDQRENDSINANSMNVNWRPPIGASEFVTFSPSFSPPPISCFCATCAPVRQQWINNNNNNDINKYSVASALENAPQFTADFYVIYKSILGRNLALKKIKSIKYDDF